MRLASPHAIELDARAAHPAAARRRGARFRSGTCCGPGSCCWPLPGWPTRQSRAGWTCASTPSASGGAGSASAGVAGLPDLPRAPAGRRRFAAVQVAEVKALACELPAKPGCRCRGGHAWNWPAKPSTPGHRATSISASTVRRWLAEDALKPWQHRSWIFLRDPTSPLKASGCSTSTPGCGTASRWAGNEYVISADEKTSHPGPLPLPPTLPPGTARTMRVEHDYHRGGALAYLAAYDVHRATSSAAAHPPPASPRSPPWSTRS